MRIQWLKVELLSDVVVSARGATAGGHQTLDYLPGSAFLGLAVGSAGEGFNPDLFWSGKVSFGDAYPLSDGGELALPFPLSFHLPKGGKADNGAEPFDGTGDRSAWGDKQVEQIKSNYLTVTGKVVTVTRTFRLKTAIDRDKSNRAAEAQLFGYEAIKAGRKYVMCLLGDPAVSEEDFDRIVASLGGLKSLGRSRSAEYGRVLISLLPEPMVFPAPVARGNQISFYLLSDLLLSTSGCPRLEPLPEDFGLAEGEFCPAVSYLKTRRYSPWNHFYNSRLSERQVICRGSVITFRTASHPTAESLRSISEIYCLVWATIGKKVWVGSWVNPGFLLNPPALSKEAAKKTGQIAATAIPSGKLAWHLKRRGDEKVFQLKALENGRAWAKRWYGLHRALVDDKKQPPGKSQWGGIRALCLSSPTSLPELWDKVKILCGGKKIRSRFWTTTVNWKGQTLSMLDVVLNELGCEEKEGSVRANSLVAAPGDLRLLNWSLYFAAVEMTRKIQSSRGDEGGKK